jgi:hypothetical protein
MLPLVQTATAKYRTLAIGCIASLLLSAVAVAQDRGTEPATPRVRTGRLLGVFDIDTGQPVVGARVLDLRSGVSAVTTSTGTLSLFFVDSSGSLVQVSKLGYYAQRFFAANSATDSTGITVLLKAAAQALPAVVTRARTGRGPADTVRALELYGFYERRTTTGAPAAAFLTGDRIGRLSLLKDLVKVNGREVCASNLYINGTKVELPNLVTPAPPTGNKGSARVIVAPPLRDGLDALFLPSEVIGIEMYRTGEVPAAYNTTHPGRCGATLVWTR